MTRAQVETAAGPETPVLPCSGTSEDTQSQEVTWDREQGTIHRPGETDRTPGPVRAVPVGLPAGRFGIETGGNPVLIGRLPPIIHGVRVS